MLWLTRLGISRIVINMVHRFLDYLQRNQVMFALFLVAAVWVLIQIRDVLFLLFLSYIIMSSIIPMVKYLRKKKFPKTLAVSIPYFSMVIVIIILVVSLVPFVASQIQSLISGFPFYLKRAVQVFGGSIDPIQVQRYLIDEINLLSKNAFVVTTQVFGGIFSLLTIFIMSFYLLMYYDEFKALFARLFKHEKRVYVLIILDRINDKLGAWMRGEIVLMFFIGLMSWISLTILNVPYALPLALLAGLLEVVPTLGPTLSAVPAVIVAFTVSPTLALTVVFVYVVIQIIENQFLVPKVMQKAVGLNPVVIILGVMIGTTLMGIGGALLAIPLISFILVIFKSLENTETK